jgi:hypothetical protein
VVDGSRRKTDRERFNAAWNDAQPLSSNAAVRRVPHDTCALLQEWADTTAPVFFDFGDDAPLWWLLAKGSNGYAYVAPFSRTDFVAIHRNGSTKIAADFQSLAGELGFLVASYERSLRTPALGRDPLQTAQIVRRPVLRGRSRGRL